MKVKTFTFLPLALTIISVIAPVQSTAAPMNQLKVVAQSSDAMWNAVATDNQNNIYVSTPLWTGSKGASVSVINSEGNAVPYPNEEWNTRDSSVSSSKRFVNVNAMHKDDKGNLWIVDTGVTTFGGKVIKGAAKLVVINLRTSKVTKVIQFPSSVLKENSYVDDIRFNGRYAYLTDAGAPAIIVLDTLSEESRRVLDGDKSTTAKANRDIFLDGKVVNAPDGTPLHVNSDPLELSMDGKWLYFAPLEGSWSKIRTKYLNDSSLSETYLSSKVMPWLNLPPVGGTVMDEKGNLYFTDLGANALRMVKPNGDINTLVVDDRLHWADAPSFDKSGNILLPAFQVDRIGVFNNGISHVQWPIRLYSLKVKS